MHPDRSSTTQLSGPCRFRSMRYSAAKFLSTLALAAILSGSVFTPKTAAGVEPASPTQTLLPMPDVLMLVLVTKDFDSVSFAYPRAVEQSKAERHLANLLRETGWTADQIRIDQAKMADGSVTTSVEFVALGTVNTESGGFPLEPIIKAFKDQRYLQVEFMLSTPFRFRGLQRFENDYVNIALHRGTNAYGYSVRIKDSSFRTLGLPLLQSDLRPDESSGIRTRTPFLYVALILLLGLLSAVLVYFLIRRGTAADTSGEG